MHLLKKVQLIIRSNFKFTTPLFLDLSPEQQELRDLARKFTKEEIIPVAAEYDRTMAYPHDILKKVNTFFLLFKVLFIFLYFKHRHS